MDLRDSLNLPDAQFTIPMKADLPKLEPRIISAWESSGLYGKIQASRAGNESFILHDGPPYTNYLVHIGTALNKILKDLVVKSRTMMGYSTPYVPGFDNHGLPIEQAVMKSFTEKKLVPTRDELLDSCRIHAQKFIDLQTTQFKRLGVFADWDHPYKTMDFRYEAEEIRVFKKLVEDGYVYKGLRPTQWSPTSQTALADTEIVYKDVVSKAIYVRFPLRHDLNGFSHRLPSFYTIIWTTTPWTIPANLAVAFNPAEEYSVVKVGENHYLIGTKLVDKVALELGWVGYETLFVDMGATFENSTFKHPIFDRDSLAVLADYVTMDEGTGVVHTAPGHGRDDFYTGIKYNLPILTPVDARGVLTAEAGEFEGVYFKKCDTVVVDRLQETGNLLKAYDYSHSYPHAERDDQPVIFRATEQWFVALDHNHLRKKMLEEVEKIEWVPPTGKARITSMVTNRPDWCISRQRPWGVGIPIFFGVPSGTPVFDPIAIESVAQLVEKEGLGAWFSKSPAEILPSGYAHPETGETEFTKETDILDVWFDSGSSSLSVLAACYDPAWNLTWPADLYLEGSDQHRGWFNTSLVLGTAVKNGAPYKQVLTHGFVTDGKGIKMAKRLGNVVDPEWACDTHGADIVRYWVASVDYTNDVPCSDGLLKAVGENYRNIRNTLRFLLSNLYDFDLSQIPATLEPLDQWAIQQTEALVVDCVVNYEKYDFGAVITGIHNFCRNELSNFFCDVIKDRMYCDGKDWPSRRSGQYACLVIFKMLLKLVAPILSFTAEEAWQTLHGTAQQLDVSNSVHLELFSQITEAEVLERAGSDLQARFAALLAIRRSINTQFEIYKVSANVKDSQDAIAKCTDRPEQIRLLQTFETGDLATMLKLSWIELSEGEPSIEFIPSPYLKCERSRLRRPDVRESDGILLTDRDRRALGVT